MKNWKLISISMAVSAFLSACGGQNFSNTLPSSNNGGVTYITYTTASSTTTVSSSASSSNLPPAISYSFKITGNGQYTTSSISTDNILKVDIKAGSPTAIVNSKGEDTGWTPAYTCVQYKVAVGEQSEVVTVTYGNPPLRSADGSYNPCYDPSTGANYPTSATVDFSGVLTSGHSTDLKVVVSQVYYDNCRSTSYYPYSYYGTPCALGLLGDQEWCFGYGKGPNYAGCNMSPVYSTHAVQGILKVHTNQTQ